ncbi:amino acid adenylation domain-containing protein [Streptomyces piniterrae]|uniref:Amino acid adenylation domain-containing protein n=1 Tax=Streptomyces piniterrae TaxID=2571125 RepID=A0A4U0NWT2_9ACTN|nr:non-ribosomal peptide synthetase [Streptomyces piniterrae]TJZ59110.1 amino acid adenylation domain-containing protein [Streptomyces piniterrae]
MAQHSQPQPAPNRRFATVAPLSSAQERLWYIDAASPGTAAYNVPLLTRWNEPVEVTALTKALEAVVARHEVLRTTYALRDGRPVQYIGAPTPVPVEVISGRAPGTGELEQRARAPFDLSAAPPLRCTVWQGGEAGDSMLLTLHHIAVDGWSLASLYEDLAVAYEQALAGGVAALPELPVQYADFAAWERTSQDAEALAKRLDARAAQLLPALGELALGSCPPRRSVPEGDRRGAQYVFRLPAELVREAEELAARGRATPFAVLFTAFQAVVQRWTQRQEFLLSTVAANRPHAAVEELVGFFVNTVPLVCRPDPQWTFERLCTEVRGEVFRILGHQRLPFDRLLARMGGEGLRASGGLADIGFILQNAPAPRTGGDPRWRPPVLLPTGTAKQDLSLVLEYGAEGGLTGTIEYDVDRYDGETARALAENFSVLLEAAVRDPGARLCELPVTRRTPGELPPGVLLGEERDLASGSRSVVEALETRMAVVDPDSPAVTCAGTDLMWGELEAWSQAVARHLRAHGAGRGSFVPVLCSRGGALVAGWLGALRSGAAFVPLAMDTPPARIEFILEETGASLALVDEAGAELLRGLGSAVKPVRLDEVRDHGDSAGRDFAEPVHPDGADPAVLIYTSGTTGRPKGVLVPHRGLLNTALWWADDCGLGSGDRLLLTAGTAFDPATFNVLEALLAGARLIVADDVERRDPRALLALIRGPEGATVAGSVTPSLLHAMLEAEAPDSEPTTLRVVYSGGEALPRRLAADCARRWNVRVRNVYGPTEASCNSTYAHVDPDDEGAPPIGVPLPGTRAYVLGPHGEELPAGIPGELHVAGIGVALGYLGRPERTATAFLPDPYATEPGALMYRTGDRVRLRPDGQLQYLGRADDQVKILGNRIEPGEIRRLIEENPAVAAAAVHATGTPAQLFAYVELTDTAAAPPAREDVVLPLRRWLPSAVLPSEVYVVDALPRTANDKVDFAALAELRDRPLRHAETRPAELTPQQRRAARLMARFLAEAANGGAAPAADDLGPDADFFTLGGHSLLAVRMLAAAEEEWGTAVPLRSFLADPNVAGLARCLTAQSDGGRTSSAGPRAAGDEGGPYPATAVQQRLWLIDRLPALRTAYLAPSVVEFTGPVDRAALREAFATVLGRHPGLRSRFAFDTEQRRVCYRTDGTAPGVGLVDATGWSDEQVDARVAEVCWSPFDLATEAPARGEVIAIGEQRTILAYGVHHIVSDGWSLEIVMDELAIAYRALATGAPLVLPEPPHPAALPPAADPGEGPDVLLTALDGAPTDAELPHDRPRGAIQDVAADSRELLLPADVTARIREVAGELRCTTFMTATALFAAVLARRSGQRDFLFAFPWAGRDVPGSADVVGMFVNTLLLRADLTDGPTWRELLARIRESAVTAFRHADTPFELLAAGLHPGRDLSRPAVTPLYVNAVDDMPLPPRLADSTESRYLRPPALKLKYELELNATGGGDRLELSLTYATALFDASTVDGLLNRLADAARDLTTDLEAPVLPTAQAQTQDLASQVAAAWCEVLDVPEVAQDVNFFEAGGDSLLLIVLLDRLSGLSDTDIDAADLFQHSTVRAQAAFLAGRDGDAEEPVRETPHKTATSRTTGRGHLLAGARRPSAGTDGERDA